MDEATPDTPAADAPAPAATTTPDAPAVANDRSESRESSGNGWRDLLAEVRGHDSADIPDDSPWSRDEEEDVEEGDDQPATPAPDAAKPDAAKPADAKPAEPVKLPAGVTLTGAAAIPWPEGAVLSLPTKGGAVVEIKTADELLAAARKGADYDRLAGTAGGLKSAHQRELTAREQKWKQQYLTQEDTLLQLAFDDEALAAFRAEHADYAPEGARKLLLEKRGRELSAEQSAANQTAQVQEAAVGVKEAAAEAFAANMQSYPYLRAEDADRVFQLTAAHVQTEHQRAVAHLKATSPGLTEQQIQDEAAAYALQFLSDEVFTAQMKALNDHYAERIGARTTATGDTPPITPARAGADGDGTRATTATGAAETDPAAHNARMSAKLTQRANRTLRPAAGGAPGTAPRPADDPTMSYADKRKALIRELSK